MEIPHSYIIHDTRIAKDFQGITICGYKRKDVIDAFQNSIINNKIEDAIRWCVELHSTGLNNQIWNSLKTIYFKYIHINNPKLFFYLLKREKDYLKIICDYPKKHEIFSRNNQEIRNLYAELTSICSLTKKNNLFLQKSLPIINNKSFEKNEIHKRIISKNIDKISDFIYNTTSNEEKLALNEIINNINYDTGTYQNCVYWYLWLEKLQNIKKKNNNNIIFNNLLTLKEQENKFFDHWIFILWNIILNYENNLDKNDAIFLRKIYNLYIKNFKLTDISGKKYYILIAFFIIFNKIKWNTLLLQQEFLIIQANANINKMYYNIINNLESELTCESKNILYKNYNKLFYNHNIKNNINNNINNINNNINIQKIKNTNLDEEINKVLFTNYPDYNKKDEEINNYEIIDDKKLVSKNMTLKDIKNQKEELKNKKINAFGDFVSYKVEKHKNILDYYNENSNENSNEIILKNINFYKRK